MDILITTSEEASVLTQAMLRASTLLGMERTEVAEAIGVSPQTLERYVRKTSALRRGSKQWELATMLVRIYLTGSILVDDNQALLQAWASSYNRAFNSSPREAFRTAQGLSAVYNYLHSERDHVQA